MSQVITFENYRPVPRYDETAWTEARVQEAASPTGPWTTIDTIELDPVDENPADPQARNLTTDEADDETGLWYRILFVDDSGAISQPTFPFQNTVLAPDPRDLCTLDDVLGYVPAYDASDTATNDKLQQLITAESTQFLADCGRDMVPNSAEAEIRTYEIDRPAAWTRRLPIGDLSTLEDVEIKLYDASGSLLEIVEPGAVVGLYGDSRDAVDVWEPITALTFPSYLPDSPPLRPGQTLTVAGVWGFPSVPPYVREGVAAGVVLRYLSDVADRGTDFAAAVDTVNFAGLARRRADAVAASKRFIAA